jgi:hypothetical protein
MELVDVSSLPKITVSPIPGRIQPIQLLVSDQLVLTKVETSAPAQETGAAEAKGAARQKASMAADEKAHRTKRYVNFIKLVMRSE